MKKLLVYLLLMCFVTLLHAQSESGQPVEEGSIRYLVTHNWTKKLASLSYMSKQRKERAAYMWGNRSEWREYTVMYFNPTQTRYLESDEKAEPDDDGYSWRKSAFFTSRDFAAQKESDQLTVRGKTYWVEDTLQCPQWKILNDLKEVAGHQCMNAVWLDTLKEQHVVAWFALDMPHSGGPERFCGLPGMILEVDINDGALLISADKIEAKKLATELESPKKVKGKKVNEAGYTDALKKFLKECREEEVPYFWEIRY